MSKKEYKFIGGPKDGQIMCVSDRMDYLDFIIENECRFTHPEKIEQHEIARYRKTKNTLGDFVYVFLG